MPNPTPVLPRRWVMERTFAWLDRYRRLSKDYEQLAAIEENRIYAATSQLMTHRLPNNPFSDTLWSSCCR
jgi:putative transposase